MEEKNENLKFNWDFCKTIYKDILFCFDKYILTTYGSSHVQFIMFYICSFRTMLSEGFLDYLWKKFISPNTSSVSKAICCYYIGSFLARYIIIEKDRVKKCSPLFFHRVKSLCCTYNAINARIIHRCTHVYIPIYRTNFVF